MEADAAIGWGATCQISSQMFPATSSGCFRFWFYMYGSGVGTLRVLLVTPGAWNSALWTLRGDQGDQWWYGQTPIDSKGSSFIVSILMVFILFLIACVSF